MPCVKTECVCCGLPTQTDDYGTCNQCHGHTETQPYYCIGADGQLHSLGEQPDYDAAEGQAKTLNVDVVWMFGRDTAKDWRDALALALPGSPAPELLNTLLTLCTLALRALDEQEYPELRNQLRTAITNAENALLTKVLPQ